MYCGAPQAWWNDFEAGWFTCGICGFMISRAYTVDGRPCLEYAYSKRVGSNTVPTGTLLVASGEKFL